MRKTFLFIVAVLAFLSCASVKKQPNPYEGTWILKQQSGGFMGRIVVPDKEIKLVIKNNKISRYENGKLLSEEMFKTEKGKTIQSSEFKDILITNTFKKQSVERKGDTLIMAEQCYDCYTFLYEKENISPKKPK